MLALPEYAIRDNTIHHTDLFSLCRGMRSQSVDMILCDLPYGTTACTWDSVIPMEPMWDAFKRIIKPRGAIVLTATEPFASHLRMAWLDGYKYDWVWAKTSATNFLNANNKPLNSHELILIFSPGTTANLSPNKMMYYPQFEQGKPYKKVNRHDRRQGAWAAGNRTPYLGIVENDGFRYPTSVIEIPHGNYQSLHPTQKPVALFEYLIKTYTQPGELVFDPCVGSGTTAVAAHKTGRCYICGDFTREYVEIARQRVIDSDPYQPTKLNDSIEQLSLFGATNE